MSKKEAQGESGGSIRSIKTKKRRNDHHSSEDNKNNRPKAGVWDMLNAKTSKLPRLEFGFFLQERKQLTETIVKSLPAQCQSLKTVTEFHEIGILIFLNIDGNQRRGCKWQFWSS